MKRLVACLSIAVAVACVMTPSSLRADVVSLLLSPPNAFNDALQDRSWRVELATAGEAGPIGNVMYGLSAFDTLTINGVNYNLDRSTWLVFSLTRSAPATRTFQGPTGPVVLSGYDFAPTSSAGYTMSGLLGISNLPPTAMAALVELKIPYQNTTYLKTLVNDAPAGKTLIDNAIGELASQGRFLAAFGRADSQDFWFMSLPDPLNVSLEFFGLSPVAAGSGVSLAWFHPLYSEGSQRVDLTQFEFSLRDFMYVSLQTLSPEQGVAALYTDRGTVLVNVVPEPPPWITVLTTAGVALIVRSRFARLRSIVKRGFARLRRQGLT